MVLQSTLHKTAEISDREDRKPAIIVDYKHNKGGMDNLDKPTWQADYLLRECSKKPDPPEDAAGAVLCSTQHSAQPETRQVNGLVGTVFYFPERVLNSGSLLYGDLGSIAQVYPGKQSKTNLVKRFKNHLHWNNVTGFFTLSDLQIDDSGVYTVENTDEGKTTHTFQLTVYCKCVYVLSKPQVTVHDNISCSLVCSVENGREVTLSWYKGGEILNQTSSPEHITLSIPLKVDEQNRDSYRCEAANPVSKETAVVPHSCIESDPFKVTDGDERTQGRLIIAVICVLVASGLVGLAIYLKKRRNGHSHADLSLLPALKDIYSTRYHRKAKKIIKDLSHPRHGMFTLLPSRRCRQYRCIKAVTERMKNNFYLQPHHILSSLETETLTTRLHKEK
ncbi:uncharacterized protein LOC135573886 [Oncorhynchus nerka]|uniref:uncharacterized protein LOC135573886 n=1 Tax=Oncorhynchus nerka TaxID=8023 RepID=UPI0031B8892E